MQEKPNVTMSLALAGLKEYAGRIDQLDIEYAQKRREAMLDRDEAIVDAVEAGYPIAKVARVCGISRTRVYQILNGEDSTKE